MTTSVIPPQPDFPPGHEPAGIAAVSAPSLAPRPAKAVLYGEDGAYMCTLPIVWHGPPPVVGPGQTIKLTFDLEVMVP